MSNPEDPFAGFENIGPSSDWQPHVTNSSPTLDVKPVTLELKCPSCAKRFNVRANLTPVIETTAAAATAEMGFNAAAAYKSYTPPKSVGKRRRAHDSDSNSKDDPPSSKKSKVVHRHLKFNN
ncbi:unnamed protein product [Fraxinus pennsylvanica]|uniref:Uncharacterized protein n=1 Tax=Fraxinus pennsylvanica TaxID=56036 RepID=A0AAD1ZSG1_9LAMI|nr:unnamed protein product [Fraxinus pennsylvanica]